MQHVMVATQFAAPSKTICLDRGMGCLGIPRKNGDSPFGW
jgi:hypothetical protein